MKIEHAPIPALRPSEYTATLIQTLQARADNVRGADVLEIGSGSGVVLAALGAMGARSLIGVDIEEAAVEIGRALMHELGFDSRAEFHRGDMWVPVSGRKFGVIAANLPHFPMEPASVGGRLATWSAGGPDGRRLLDAFGGLEGAVERGTDRERAAEIFELIVPFADYGFNASHACAYAYIASSSCRDAFHHR